jgi:hypothetical protein
LRQNTKLATIERLLALNYDWQTRMDTN